MKKFWEIRAAKKDKTGELMVYGLITSAGGGVFGSDSDVTPKGFADGLKALGDISTLNIYINSHGGDPFAAHAIYSILKRHKAEKHVYVDGIAASAASMIAMAGDKVIMPINSMIMVHLPRAVAMGTSEEIRKSADALDAVAESMAVLYTEKTGLSKDEIMSIMAEEVWYSAEEAVKKGFADEIEQEMKVAASLNANLLVVNGQEVDIQAFRNFPRDKISARQEPAEDKAEQERQARLRRLLLRAQP